MVKKRLYYGAKCDLEALSAIVFLPLLYNKKNPRYTVTTRVISISNVKLFHRVEEKEVSSQPKRINLLIRWAEAELVNT